MKKFKIKMEPNCASVIVDPSNFERLVRVKMHTIVDIQLFALKTEDLTAREYEEIGRGIIDQAVDQMTNQLN